MAVLILANSQVSQVTPEVPPRFAVYELWKMLGGCYDIVNLVDSRGEFLHWRNARHNISAKGSMLLIKEEWGEKQLPLNELATEIVNSSLLAPLSKIHGPAIFCGWNELEE